MNCSECLQTVYTEGLKDSQEASVYYNYNLMVGIVFNLYVFAY